jgi:signal transduction histidine kinase
MLRALSKSSHAMLRATDEDAFLAEVCRIVVEDCGHAMVWIGYAEDGPDKAVRPVAHAGFEAGYLETLQLSWADTERGRGPTGTAIRTGVTSACRNMQTDPRFTPWREEAVRRGYASSIVCPLIADERPFGAITIYSREEFPFLEDEQRLIEELARDLSYGIAALRERAARRKAEEALRESERRARELAASLQEADRRKNEFFGVLSHELRNPLAPVQYALHILDRAEPGSEQGQRAKEVIRRQAKHLGRIVDDLLDVTRISHGKIRLNRERIDLSDLAGRVVEDQRSLFGAKEIALELRASPEPLWIDADPTRLSQVIANLLQNAAKFTNAHGHVALRVERRGEGAAVIVADDGIGVAPELLAELFEPFRQVDHGLARNAGGLGLGLALVRGLVELHGGTVEARSPGVGRGAEFAFVLPLAADAADRVAGAYQGAGR